MLAIAALAFPLALALRDPQTFVVVALMFGSLAIGLGLIASGVIFATGVVARLLVPDEQPKRRKPEPDPMTAPPPSRRQGEGTAR
jgi:hypothetical protein